MYAGNRNNWCHMKKFSEYMLQKEQLETIETEKEERESIEDMDHEEVLRMFGKLDIEDRKVIKNQLVEMFRHMLTHKSSFVKAVEFVMTNVPKEDKQDVASVFDRVKRFFDNPVERGLAYISGQNEIVNDKPNINQNGSTNNTYQYSSP